jgi:flagellar biosynthesis anti-sigma factor FlgM
MKIDGFQNIPAILQTFKTSKAASQNLGSETNNSSSVSFSSFAEVLQTVQRQSAQAMAERSSKVEDLAQKVQAGKYSVDVDKLAASLVESRVINTKG